MLRLLRGFSIAARRLIRHPGRTVLIQAGLAGGVAALVATLCLIEGSKQKWSSYSRYSEPTHLTLDGAWVLMSDQNKAVTLMGFQAEFGKRIDHYDTEGHRLRLFPKREDDLALANDIEVWLLERGAPAKTKWRVKGSRQASIQETIRRIGVLFYTAAVLCVLTGAIGLFAIQKSAADQRRVELAVRRVEGATTLDVLSMLLAEALLVAALGLALGTPIGAGSGYVIADLIDDAGFAFPIEPIALCVGVLAALAVIFGLLPAWSAVRTEPSATLHEA
jgi:hypothetical protein